MIAVVSSDRRIVLKPIPKSAVRNSNEGSRIVYQKKNNRNDFLSLNSKYKKSRVINKLTRIPQAKQVHMLMLVVELAITLLGKTNTGCM